MKSNLTIQCSFSRFLFTALLTSFSFFTTSPIFAINNAEQISENIATTQTTNELDNRNALISKNVESDQFLFWTLTASQWEISRNGEAVLSLAVINDLMQTWLNSVKSLQNDTSPFQNEMMVIQYPGGEEGEVWVQELTDWLVALGVPSRYITILPGSIADDEIIFQLYNN